MDLVSVLHVCQVTGTCSKRQMFRGGSFLELEGPGQGHEGVERVEGCPLPTRGEACVVNL